MTCECAKLLKFLVTGWREVTDESVKMPEIMVLQESLRHSLLRENALARYLEKRIDEYLKLQEQKI